MFCYKSLQKLIDSRANSKKSMFIKRYPDTGCGINTSDFFFIFNTAAFCTYVQKASHHVPVFVVEKSLIENICNGFVHVIFWVMHYFPYDI